MLLKETIETELGTLVAGATSDGICLLEFADRKSAEAELRYLEKYYRSKFIQGVNDHIAKVKEELEGYFMGTVTKFTVPLSMAGSPFQLKVWKELLRIPYGTTRSYHSQALALGNENIIRAVARANASNRIAIVIPCHRVIGSDGSLTGYGGGLARKKWLIEHEGMHSGKPVDMKLF